MREIRSSGSAEGVMSNHDPYSDRKRRSDSILASKRNNRCRTREITKLKYQQVSRGPIQEAEK